MPCGTWDLPGPGIEPMSPALVAGFFTTEPPGKPYSYYLCCHLVQNTLCITKGVFGDGFCTSSLFEVTLTQYVVVASPADPEACWSVPSPLPGTALMLCRGRGHSATPLCSMLHLTHQAGLLLLPTHCTSWQVGALLSGCQLPYRPSPSRALWDGANGRLSPGCLLPQTLCLHTLLHPGLEDHDAGAARYFFGPCRFLESHLSAPGALGARQAPTREAPRSFHSDPTGAPPPSK